MKGNADDRGDYNNSFALLAVKLTREEEKNKGTY